MDKKKIDTAIKSKTKTQINSSKQETQPNHPSNQELEKEYNTLKQQLEDEYTQFVSVCVCYYDKQVFYLKIRKSCEWPSSITKITKNADDSNEKAHKLAKKSH
jgi:hypothetical protein